MKKRFDWLKGPRVLDVGCATGLGCYLAAQREDIRGVWGIDVDQWSVLEAIERSYSGEVDVGKTMVDFLELPAEEIYGFFGPLYFNSVLLGEVLEHVTDANKVVAEVSGVLKLDGVVVASVPRGGHITEDHVRVFNEQGFRDLMESRFEITEFRRIPNVTKSWLACVGIKK